MTRKFKLFFHKAFFISVFIFFSEGFSVAASDWVLAAQKFQLSEKQTDTISNALSSMIPSRILDNLGSNNFRTILDNEQYERELYDLKKNQNSLFLQLSSEVKKRDSLVLTSVSKKELEKKISEEDEKIQDIKNQIQENLTKRKELEETIRSEATERLVEKADSKNEYGAFFKKLFSSSEQEENLVEKITFYRNDSLSLYTPDAEALEKGYLSAEFEKEILSASIRALITGRISLYGEYMAVSVEVYGYPNAKSLVAVTEVGTVDDADFICSSIARQLVPPLSNSLPVTLYFALSPASSSLYIDDVLLQEIPEKLTLDSGVHTVLLEADGYKSAGTNYFFAGNNTYRMEIKLQEDSFSKVRLYLPNAAGGTLYANGQLYQGDENGISDIKINGENVLSQFIREDGKNAFVYIGKNSFLGAETLSAKAKFVDRNEYIEKRRRWMYNSYTGLIISLIPLFYTQGVFSSYNNAAYLDDQALQKANIWSIASNVSAGISIGMGAWFIFELVRYLKSADSVLPYEANEYKGTLDFGTTPLLETVPELYNEQDVESE